MRISLLLVNWNGLDDTRACLTDLAAQRFRDFEAILVDNASSDGSARAIAAEFPWVRLLALSENTGFAEANNRAAKEAIGEWLLVVNTDTRFAPDFLETLDRAITAHPDYELFSLLMLRLSDPARIDCTGLRYSFELSGRMLDSGRALAEVPPEGELFGPTGGAMLLKRSALERLGQLFDPAFFFNNEDVDFALRARGAGIRTLFLPEARVLHRRSPNEARLSDTVLYYIQRNFPLAAYKNVPLALWLALGPLHLAYNAWQIGKWAKKGKAGVVLRAKRDAILLAPKLTRKPVPALPLLAWMLRDGCRVLKSRRSKSA